MMSLGIRRPDPLRSSQLLDRVSCLSQSCQLPAQPEADIRIVWGQAGSALQRFNRGIALSNSFVCQAQRIETLSIFWLSPRIVQDDRNRLGILLQREQYLPQRQSASIHASVQPQRFLKLR